ncbi:hypothetical protein [Oceanirhabdus sp. W0125-5]|uniref:hypothetical protein n=1 Tax=Oceanirhabdus sp. W0125-5 TaxID=2999116 RepID=UPI0022F319B8|nr:hypothetical protein [Oceanirhabdus sp. W0125-5]WBW98925.1 hypothetical protein OW730_09325 [Oceanirhabdus sp. W0125-5]
MKKSIFVVSYFFILILSLSIILIIKSSPASSPDETISVFNKENTYYTIDLNGDHMKDIVLLSWDTTGADIVISTEDEIISMSTLLNKKVQSPFYIFFEDITADNTPELIIYDLSEKNKNILYVYTHTQGVFKNILEEQCQSFGLVKFTDSKKICITTEKDYYLFSPTANNTLTKSPFSSLSSILREDSYFQLIDIITDSNLYSKHKEGTFKKSTIPSSFMEDIAHENSTYLGGYFSIEIDNETFEYSPTEWHSLFTKTDKQYLEYIFRIDKDSISMVEK